MHLECRAYGSDTITGTYSTDANFTGSSGTTTLSVSKAASGTIVTANPSSATYGQTVTYGATISDGTTGSSGTPTGTVAVTTGATTLCTITLSGGTGTCTSAAAPSGSNTITGTYSGDANFSGSNGTTTLAALPGGKCHHRHGEPELDDLRPDGHLLGDGLRCHVGLDRHAHRHGRHSPRGTRAVHRHLVGRSRVLHLGCRTGWDQHHHRHLLG